MAASLNLVVFLFLCEAILISNCSLNFFMNKTETMKILGREGSIYYVREGTINQQAVKFEMTVPTQVDWLGFTWYARPDTLFYYFDLRSESPDLLYPPIERTIKSKGRIPLEPLDFSVRMQCRGTKDGTARMVIQLNVTMDLDSIKKLTVLNLKRMKTCRKVVAAVPSDQVPLDPAPSATGSSSSFSQSEKTKVFYIAVGVACSIIFVIALAVAAIHVHSIPSQSTSKDEPSAEPGPATSGTAARQAPKVLVVNVTKTESTGNATSNTDQQPNTPAIQTNHVPIKVELQLPSLGNPEHTRSQPLNSQIAVPISHLVPNGDAKLSRSTGANLPGTHIRNGSVSSVPGEGYCGASGLAAARREQYRNRDIRAELKDLTVEMDCITLGDLLQEGTFARIYEGVLTGPKEVQQQSVIVKTVSQLASTEQVNILLIESSTFRDLTHKNLLPISAVCLEDEKQPLVMFPFMNRGNLKLFLKKSRSPEGGSKSLTTADLVHIGIQIAKGMQYLARRRIVHGDLAARNCVLDDDLNVKVTDCALARDLFAQDYCCLGDNENRPVKWMAVESLEHHRYTVSSDVWAYGVTLWELMTLGNQPYANIDAFEMLNFLKQGHRVAQPVNCPDELFTVIACCWALSEDERPSFGQLMVRLLEFLNALSNFV